MNKDESKETEIKKSFNKTLSMYPIKNLEDLYDKEGYRDEEFNKGDKGMWIVHSEMNIQKRGKHWNQEGWFYIWIEIQEPLTAILFLPK